MLQCHLGLGPSRTFTVTGIAPYGARQSWRAARRRDRVSASWSRRRRVRGARARAHHAARRLDHRLARLLAGAALEPAAEHRLHQHRLRRHARPAGLRRSLRRRQRGPRRLPRHQRRRPEPAAGWLSAARPDIVLMHFGTNDVWSNRADRDDPGRVRQAGRPDAGQQPGDEDPGREDHPDEPVATARECAAAGGRPQRRRSRPGRRARRTAASPITVVDQWTGFNTATDTYDGVHPNAAGNQKMSDRWYPALAAVLDGGVPSPSPRSPPRLLPRHLPLRLRRRPMVVTASRPIRSSVSGRVGSRAR